VLPSALPLADLTVAKINSATLITPKLNSATVITLELNGATVITPELYDQQYHVFGSYRSVIYTSMPWGVQVLVLPHVDATVLCR
jgi:hypothetical protein